LIGALDFEQTESQIEIEALAARYDDPDFWNRALIEAPDDSLALPFWSVGHFLPVLVRVCATSSLHDSQAWRRLLPSQN